MFRIVGRCFATSRRRNVGVGDATLRDLPRLQAALARHDELYYNEARPELSDAAYDALRSTVDRLQQRQKARRERSLSSTDTTMTTTTTTTTATTSTTTVGAAVSATRSTVAHVRPMVSLQHARQPDELHDFVRRSFDALPATLTQLDCVVELKFDGMSIAARYRDAQLQQGLLFDFSSLNYQSTRQP